MVDDITIIVAFLNVGNQPLPINATESGPIPAVPAVGTKNSLP